MNENNSKKFENHIDLTSLLDVIFIILVVVLCSQQLTNKHLHEDLDAAKEKIGEGFARVKDAENDKEDAETRADMYKNTNSAMENIFDDVSIVEVAINYEIGNPSTRKLNVIIDNGEPYIQNFDENSESEVLNSLKDRIVDHVSGSVKEGERKPVILNLDITRILYRDEEFVKSFFDDLSSSNEYDIYVKYVENGE